jgi:gas vesicle protein
MLLAAPELVGRQRLGGLVGAAAAALAALLGQVPRQGRALRVHFPVEDLEDLQIK